MPFMLVLATTIISVAVLLLAAPRLFWPHLLPLWESGSLARLDFSPNQLSGYDILVVLSKLLSRSIRHSAFRPWINLTSGEDPPDQQISLSMPLRTSQADLDAYVAAGGGSALVGVSWRGPQQLLFLSALAEPAMLLLLARNSCKVRPLGAVNVRNRIELLRPDLCTMPLLMSFAGATLTASCSQKGALVKRGFEYDLGVSLQIPSEAPGQPVTVFRQIFTILQFSKHVTNASHPARPSNADPSTKWTDSIPFSLKADDPSLWAKVCKDYNPIHISAIAAKMLGLPGIIAHGNHVAVKAFASLEQSTLPTGYAEFCRKENPRWMEIAFIRPIKVPTVLNARVSMRPSNSEDSSNEYMAFEILEKEKVCIRGRFGYS